MNNTLQLSSNQDLSIQDIQSLIITLPNRPKAMLAKDLADIYQTETRSINQAVQRNPERFPSDFMFQATDEEKTFLTSQFVMSKKAQTANPYLFTREGANMLSAVLHSKVAVQRSVQIMRAFSAMEQQQQDAPIKQQIASLMDVSATPTQTLTTAIFENPAIAVAIQKKTCSGNGRIDFNFEVMLPVKLDKSVDMSQEQFDKIIETFTLELKFFLAKGFDMTTFGTTKMEIASKPPKTTEEKLNMLEEMQAKYFKAIEERDEALKTKSAIGDKKTASAMSKAANLTIQNRKLIVKNQKLAEEIKRLKKEAEEKSIFN